jgi:hypothetical protein
MITSMETWIAVDHTALRKRFGNKIRLTALPPVTGIEARTRVSILAALKAATRDCVAAYTKGAISFELVGMLSPDTLMALPAFARVRRVLDANLPV